MAKVVSALKARRNFGELINRAYYRGEDTIIEKKGKTVAKITRVEPFGTSATDLFMKTAGAWKDLDTEPVKKKIRKLRKDGSSKREFLANW